MIMKGRHIRSLSLGAMIILALIVSGCRTPSISSTPTELPEATSTTPTYTKPAPIETVTASYTATAAPTRTSTPAATATEIRTPTWTPLATLPPSEAAKFARDLYTNNAGCRLPCWWGATPGETQWNKTDQFLSSFTRRIGQADTKHINPESGEDYTITVIGFFVKIEGLQQEGTINYSVRQGIINEIDVSRPGTELSYQVQQLLKEYGEPGEMWLIVDPYDIVRREPSYNLIVFYPDKGIMAEYEGEAIRQGSQYKICPDGAGPNLILYPPDKDLSIQSVYSYIFSYLKPVQEATGLSIENIFLELSRSRAACIETPVSMWE
jgi:hypothetical protein